VAPVSRPARSGAIQIDWNQDLRGMQERMVEYAFGAIAPKRERAISSCAAADLAVVRLLSVRRHPAGPRHRILASTIRSAIDQASVDLVNEQPGHPLSTRTALLGPGADKFRAPPRRSTGGSSSITPNGSVSARGPTTPEALSDQA